MALQRRVLKQNRGLATVSITSLQSTFERLASMRRGSIPKLDTCLAAKQTSSETSLQIANYATQAIAAQAKIESERAIALLSQHEGLEQAK